MTHLYPDLGGASDWSCHMGNLIQPIRSTTQIWKVMHHQYGISALVSRTKFGRETRGSFAKCWLFSQATHYPHISFCVLLACGFSGMTSTKQIACQQATSIAVLIQLNVVISKVCRFALNLNILLIPFKNIALQICQELRD